MQGNSHPAPLLLLTLRSLPRRRGPRRGSTITYSRVLQCAGTVPSTEPPPPSAPCTGSGCPWRPLGAESGSVGESSNSRTCLLIRPPNCAECAAHHGTRVRTRVRTCTIMIRTIMVPWYQRWYVHTRVRTSSACCRCSTYNGSCTRNTTVRVLKSFWRLLCDSYTCRRPLERASTSSPGMLCTYR
jgi:hypothetical protein